MNYFYKYNAIKCHFTTLFNIFANNTAIMGSDSGLTILSLKRIIIQIMRNRIWFQATLISLHILSKNFLLYLWQHFCTDIILESGKSLRTMSVNCEMFDNERPKCLQSQHFRLYLRQYFQITNYRNNFPSEHKFALKLKQNIHKTKISSKCYLFPVMSHSTLN